MEFDLNRYKKILNQTMKAFIAFCTEHNITYYASGGTALGAIRHQGIIPWDDDIDVYMRRSEYERFLSLRGILEGTQYGIISAMEGEYYLPFGKFYDKHTTLWELKECACIFGIYIDIFVLDEAQSDSPKCLAMGRSYREYFEKWRRSLNRHSFQDLYRAIGRGDAKSTKFILGTWCRKPLRAYYKARTHTLLQRIRQFRGDQLYTYGIDSASPRLMYPKEWFETTETLPFEDYTISVHSGVRNYLSALYGDYMQLPKEEDRVSLHVKYYINMDEGLTLPDTKQRMRQEGLEEDFKY